MPLDGVSINCLATELNQTLANARVDRIYQPDRFELILQLRNNGQNSRLLLSANPSAPRVHLTDDPGDNPGSPPMFCMLLRKHLSGSRLLNVSTTGFERILDFHFQNTDELGDTVSKTLVVEIMGRHSNIILLNQDGFIHDSLIHVDAAVSRVREVMPARRYVRPPEQDKDQPDHVFSALQNGSLPWPAAVAGKTLSQALLIWIQGFSPQLCQEVVYRSGLDDRLRAGELDDSQISRLRLSLHEVLSAVVNGQYQPSVFLKQPGDRIPVDFHALPLQSFAYRQAVPTLSAAMDRFYTDQNRQNQINQRRDVMVKRVKKALELALHKRAIHQDDVEAAADSDSIQKTGNLILANLSRWVEGSPTLEAIDYFDPEQPLVLIPIEPGRTAARTAQLLFKTYARVKRRGEISQKLLRHDLAEIDWLESLLHELSEADTMEALAAIQEEIDQGGLVRSRDESALPVDQTLLTVDRLNPGKAGSRVRRHQKRIAAGKSSKAKPKKTNESKALPPRQFISSDGFTILVGRNNLQNDSLTLRTAAKDDWWFHVQKMPGSHVIVRTEQKPLPDRTIEEAAAIAAWFSRATVTLGGKQSPTGLKVPVDYCPVSHVQKPRGAKPGMVIYDRYQTILVTPKEPKAPA